MLRRCWFFVLFVIALVAQGCQSLDDAPAPFRSAEAKALEATSLLTSCGVTKEDVAAVSLDGLDAADTLSTATRQFMALREATKAVDAKLESHLARVGPALEDEKVKALVASFEEHAELMVDVYEPSGMFAETVLTVKEIRARYFASVKRLAAVLDAIGSSPRVAGALAAQPELKQAYLELADSPCPARSIRFAAILLSLDRYPDSPYAPAARGDYRQYATAMLDLGLARAFVERLVENTGPGSAPEVAVDGALDEIRGYIGLVTGVSDKALKFLQNRANARALAMDPTFQVQVDGHDLTQAFRAINAVMFWWGVVDAATAQDVGTLLKQSPAIAESAARGVAALAGHFEATRVAGAATKFASAAAQVAKAIGIVFQVQGIIDTLDQLDDPGSDTVAVVTKLVGQCMLLVSSVMPPPLNFVVGGVGQIAVWVAGLIADPPPDELIPVLEPLVASGELTEAEKTALLEAHASNIWALGRALRLAPKDVRWVLETVRLNGDNNPAKHPGHFGSPQMGLYRIHLETGLEGDAMAKYLRSIGSSQGAAGRFELHTFALYSAATHLFLDKTVKQALVDRRAALVEYDVKYEAAEVGIDAKRALTLARGAFDRAIAGLPASSCPGASAARCSGDGRFVVWCEGGAFLRTYDCWEDDKSCVLPEEGAGHCADR